MASLWLWQNQELILFVNFQLRGLNFKAQFSAPNYAPTSSRIFVRSHLLSIIGLIRRQYYNRYTWKKENTMPLWPIELRIFWIKAKQLNGATFPESLIPPTTDPDVCPLPSSPPNIAGFAVQIFYCCLKRPGPHQPTLPNQQMMTLNLHLLNRWVPFEFRRLILFLCWVNGLPISSKSKGLSTGSCVSFGIILFRWKKCFIPLSRLLVSFYTPLK